VSDWLAAPHPDPRIGPFGWLRVGLRITVLGAVTYGGLAVVMLLRLIEAPLFGRVRPWTPYITQMVCKASLAIMRLPLTVTGTPMRAKGAVVANHASWLDIFTLNACQRVYFVSKSEVRGWLGIGWLARATGTVFITRKGGEAKVQAKVSQGGRGEGASQGLRRPSEGGASAAVLS
jgi:lyso-ornithine lipid O-acyltransferase